MVSLGTLLTTAGLALGALGCGDRAAALDRLPEPSAGQASAPDAPTPSATAGHPPSAAAASVGGSDASAPGSALFRSRLEATARAIAPRIGIPFRVPLVALGAPDDDSTFVTVRTATATGYDVVLGDQNCDGATYCRVGRVTGKRLGPGVAQPTGKAVTLPGVGAARFAESVCGANCSDAVLTWDQDGVRYTIGIKAAEFDDFKAVARSVVRLP